MIPSTHIAQSASLDDADVVRRVRAGETALFEVLVRRHDQRVYRTIRSILRDEGEVEDAMQQAWLQAYLHLAEFAGAAAFSTWLVRIAANEALQRLRRRKPLSAVSADGEEDTVDLRADDPEERAASREAVRLVERAVDRLPAHYRTVFVLREVEGLSTADTAAALGIGEEAAKVRLHRARSLLRDSLSELIGDSAAEAFQFLAPRCNRMVARVMAAIEKLGDPGTA
ncbi:MAG TPA: RNA polymerase sigma factor [Anaeromyxobacter sp.]